MKSKILKPRSFIILLCLYLLSSNVLFAEDTLRLSIHDAEQTFINKNLSLLAEKYNINITQAQAIQARLYNNPNFSFTGDIYNPEEKKILDVSKQTGEYIVGVQQLILLAGKRNKQIKLANTNVALAGDRFYDLLRTLLFTLRTDYYQLYYLQQSLKGYATQIDYLKQMTNSYEELEKKGIVTLKDAVRIKSLLYSLETEQNNYQNQADDLNASLQLLLHKNGVQISPLADKEYERLDVEKLQLSELLDTAYKNRADLKLAQHNLLYNQQNYQLQKALAVPDLSAGIQFDKRGSFVDNASFFNLAIDLPFFNRNQGNIQSAKIAIDQAKTQLQAQQESLENEVQRAYMKVLKEDKLYKSIDPYFKNQLDQLLQTVVQNFQKKNISLLDFTDFYESYKENLLQYNQLQSDRILAIQNLQYTIGKTIF